jgi:glutamate N-acetyltransferase/amino-acid N-acetyltransferase
MKKNILPNGFFSAGLSAGIKPDNSLDMALIVSDNIASAAGVFTTNQVYAAPVKLCKEHLVNNQAKAIIVNSGVANACTGKEGYNSAVEMTKETAKHLECNLTDVLVCSTGKIGPQLPMDKIKSGIFNLSKSLSENNLDITSKAIMTTDTHPKIVTKSIFLNNQKITITGVAKGAGMIEPNMATMLAFIMTDAKINSFDLNKCLKDAVDVSFNRITVDGDQSTNDTVLILANGLDDTYELNPNSNEWNDFTIALKEVCFELAMMIVHDGEGADRFITLKVIGALNDEEADIAARSVANSLLNKTAWAGSYPDWGRIMDAIGYSSAKIIPENVSIFYGNVQAVEHGCQYNIDHQVMVDAVSEKELLIKVHLGLADGEATIYTCNCTERYVRINY